MPPTKNIDLKKAEKISKIRSTLLTWFENNRRDLPWRKKTATNYHRIVSEVFLQKTKAERVAEFFPGFIKQYPSWRKLSEATVSDLEEILRPLGLFRQRAVRLYGLAQKMKERGGRFPSEREQIEAIPMVGQYIGSAVELFYWGRDAALVDVNMVRFISRVFSPGKKSDYRYDPHIQDLAQAMVEGGNAIDINWGIFDLCAQLCRPSNPKCETCPIKGTCNFGKSQFGKN